MLRESYSKLMRVVKDETERIRQIIREQKGGSREMDEPRIPGH